MGIVMTRDTNAATARRMSTIYRGESIEIENSRMFIIELRAHLDNS
jgi:hypothetical protein